MTYVITSRCTEAKDLSCVAACPVDCIHPTAGEDGFDDVPQLYIDPDVCIDCRACADVCPVSAPVFEDDLTDEDRPALEENAAWFRRHAQTG